MMLSILNFLITAFKWYFCLIIPGAAFSLFQEKKLWDNIRPLSAPSLVRVYLLNIGWMVGCFICACMSVPLFAIKNAEEVGVIACKVYERFMCQTLCFLFIGPVEVRGKENLPPSDDSVPHVYISNHSSQIDTMALYFINRTFKWIAKKAVRYLPGVGQIVMVAKHILLNRKGKGSIKQMYEDSHKAVTVNGHSLFLFPQGTRTLEKRLPFKNGAFNIAIDAGVPIVPITIDIPTDAWGTGWIPSRFTDKPKDPIILTIHPIILVNRDADKEELKIKCYETVYSCLPPLTDGEPQKSDDKKSK